jgi:broad specificity phosphatase PhoE
VYSITLLRHGESVGNSSGVLQGQSDYPLTSTGLAQAQQLANSWQAQSVAFDKIISSPLLRARQTAEIIGGVLDSPLTYEPAWMERNFGDLQDAALEELHLRQPEVDYFHPYQAIGGVGESMLDLYIRAGLAIQDLLRHPPGAYLVVSHGAILNKALYVILGITPQGHYNSPIFHFGNTGYAQFRYNPDSRQWVVLSLISQTEHSKIQGTTSWQQD